MKLKPDDFDEQKHKEQQAITGKLTLHKQTYRSMSPYAGKLTDYPCCENCYMSKVSFRGKIKIINCSLRMITGKNREFVPKCAWCECHVRK